MVYEIVQNSIDLNLKFFKSLQTKEKKVEKICENHYYRFVSHATRTWEFLLRCLVNGVKKHYCLTFTESNNGESGDQLNM